MMIRANLKLALLGSSLVLELGVEQIATADGGDVEACFLGHISQHSLTQLTAKRKKSGSRPRRMRSDVTRAISQCIGIVME